jgi:uncharacterized protein YcfJ
MKKIAWILLGVVSLLPASAQWLRPEAVNGALWGGLIGGVVGGNRHHGFSGNGAAIGAGVGLIAGTLTSESRRNYYYDSPSYGYTTYPSVSFGYGYGGYGNSAYVYYAPNNYCAPGYYYRPTRPNYVVSGTVLGAASGALIGAGRHDAGKGALIGAGAGLLLGSVAEHAANREERRVLAAQNASQPYVVTASATSDVRPLTSDSSAARNVITSKPVATSTYTWTPRPQIADAPSVPDAPTY